MTSRGPIRSVWIRVPRCAVDPLRALACSRACVPESLVLSVLVFGVMAFATPGGRPSPASMLGGPAAGRGLLFTGYVPYQSTCARLLKRHAW